MVPRRDIRVGAVPGDVGDGDGADVVSAQQSAPVRGPLEPRHFAPVVRVWDLRDDAAGARASLGVEREFEHLEHAGGVGDGAQRAVGVEPKAGDGGGDVASGGGRAVGGVDGGRVRGRDHGEEAHRALGGVRVGAEGRGRVLARRAGSREDVDAAGVGAEHHVRVGHVETKEAHARPRHVGQVRRLRHRAP